MSENEVVVMAKLRPNNNCQPFALCFLSSSKCPPATRWVNGDRLFNENVLTCFNCRLNEERMESVGNRYQHDVGIGGENFFVSRWTTEASFRWDTVFLASSQGTLSKPITKSDHFNFNAQEFRRLVNISDSTPSSPTAANESNLEGFWLRIDDNCGNAQRSPRSDFDKTSAS